MTAQDTKLTKDIPINVNSIHRLDIKYISKKINTKHLV